MSDPLNPNTEVPVYHPVLNDILFETKDNVDLTYNVNHGLIEMCSNPMKVQAKLNDLMAGWADSDSEKKKCSLLQNIWNILSKSILKNKALKCLFEGSYGTIKRCSENENNILELRPALDQMAINSSMYGMRFYDVYLSDSKEYARIPTVILVIITNTLEYSISKVAKHNLTDTYTSGELLHKLKASVKDCNANVNPANKETMEIYKNDVKDIDKAKSIQELENWAKNLINKVSDIAASNEPKTLFQQKQGGFLSRIKMFSGSLKEKLLEKFRSSKKAIFNYVISAIIGIIFIGFLLCGIILMYFDQKKGLIHLFGMLVGLSVGGQFDKCFAHFITGCCWPFYRCCFSASKHKSE